MAKLLSQNEVSLCYVFKVFLKRSSKQAWLLAIKIDLFKCCSQSQRGDIKAYKSKRKSVVKNKDRGEKLRKLALLNKLLTFSVVLKSLFGQIKLSHLWSKS